jgi:hypothetical protein
VWRYIAGYEGDRSDTQSAFVDDMKKPVLGYVSSAAHQTPKPPKQSIFGCRVHKVDDGIEERLKELEDKVGNMTKGMESMLDALDK